MSDSDRRAEIAARTGIDEPMIHRLVHGFYDRVRVDPMLGPVFDERIKDWAPHLARMVEFWSSVTLLTGRYSGRPMPAHVRLPISAAHFDRWLALFEQTATELCPPHAAAFFLEKARNIARSFEFGIAAFRGQMPGPDGRLPDAAA